jgi:dTDP-4-dehydrorhamnose 3,5-epimerase
MLFRETPFAGAFVVEAQRLEDERGFFARTWDRGKFAEQGLDPNLVQTSLSYNRNRGTLRGMHFQYPPHSESKLVRCVRGSVYDVIVDLRPHSATFLQWFGTELTEDNLWALFVPKGFAHGFQSLQDDSLVHYQMSDAYAPAAAGGLRWNDPAVGIVWPLPVSVIAERDAGYPDLPADRAVFEPFRVLSL